MFYEDKLYLRQRKSKWKRYCKNLTVLSKFNKGEGEHAIQILFSTCRINVRSYMLTVRKEKLSTWWTKCWM